MPPLLFARLVFLCAGRSALNNLQNGPESFNKNIRRNKLSQTVIENHTTSQNILIPMFTGLTQ